MDRPSGHRARWLVIAVGAAVLGGAAPALAQPIKQDEPAKQPADAAKDKGPQTQPPEDLAAFEGRPIRKIVLQRPVKGATGEKPKYVPLDEELTGLVENQLRARVGTPYRQQAVTDDITRLTRIGRFGPVENRVQLLEDGSVLLTYTLEPQPVVRDVQSVGNRKLSDQDIAKEVDILKGTPVDRYQLDRACRRIEGLYREKGYYLAQVTVDEKALEDSGTVLFQVREGERLKVTDIRFEGNRSFSPRELRSQIKTKEASLLDKGALDDDLLELDVAALVEFYKDRGYLDVRLGRTYRPSLNGREAIVTFQVEEGRLYTLRNVTAYYPEGERVFKTAEEARAAAGPGEAVLIRGRDRYVVYRYGVFSVEQVIGLMKLKPGDVYSQNLIRKSLDAVRMAYGQMGYTDAKVDRLELRDPDEPRVDLVLEIREGRRFRTGEVIVQGNHITQDNVIRREILNRPGRPADTTSLDESRRRLNQTHLFRPGSVKFSYQAPDPQDPEFRDLIAEMEETNTGRFRIGVSIGSDNGLVGQIGLEQDNFDIADTPDSLGEFMSGRSFRGRGQKFKIQVAPGNRFETYSVSLTEPSLFDTDYSGSGSLFYTSNDYDEFSEDRVGTHLGIGRNFGSRWSASVPLRVENINLRNITPDSAEDLFLFQGENLLTGLGLRLTRSTLNDTFRPSHGRYIELSAEQVGALGGDFSFSVFKAEHNLYIPIHEDFLGRKTVMQWKTRVGYIPQERNDVPVYERFYLGGQSFRGFDYRAISPIGIRNDTKTLGDDSVGGTWMFFTGVEVVHPVLEELISVVGFVDTGTVTFTPGFSEYRVSVGFGLRLYYPAISPAPLAFDFGFPILRQDTDRERVFTFNVDLPF